jgi:Tfp pilus assembly protein PilF
MRSCFVLLLALAACEDPNIKKQTDADRDRCQQYHGSDAAAAIDACTHLVQADDDRLVRYLHAYSWRAQAFMELQQWEPARADFRKVLDLDPGNAFATRKIRQQEYELRTGSRAFPK